MDDADLRHLRRADLLALLEELSRENDRLRQELEEANSRVAEQEVRISQCGSLAEAALQLSGVFKAADAAARQYVHMVRRQAAATDVGVTHVMAANPGTPPLRSFEQASVGTAPQPEVESPEIEAAGAEAAQAEAPRRRRPRHARPGQEGSF